MIRLAPHSLPQHCSLPPVFVDYYLKDSRGYGMPRLPQPPI
jgi:hypothetical protein